MQLPQGSGRGASPGQVEVGDELAEEEPRAVLGVEKAAVLAPGPDPGGGGPRLLRDRAGVHVGPRLEGPGLLPQPRGQAVEHRLHHVVVVVAPGVPRDPAAVGGGVGGVRPRRVVLEPHAQDRSRPGEGRAQVAALRHLARQVGHLARVPAGHPLGEEREVGRRVGPRDAGRGRSRPRSRAPSPARPGWPGSRPGPDGQAAVPHAQVEAAARPPRRARAAPGGRRARRRPARARPAPGTRPARCAGPSPASRAPRPPRCRRRGRCGPRPRRGRAAARRPRRPARPPPPAGAVCPPRGRRRRRSKTRRFFKKRREGRWTMRNSPTLQLPSEETRTPSGASHQSAMRQYSHSRGSPTSPSGPPRPRPHSVHSRVPGATRTPQAGHST